MARKKSYTQGKLPFNNDAEKVVLGSAISGDAQSLINVISSLQEEDFYSYQHKEIFKAITQCWEKSRSVDIYTITEELENLKVIEEIGGVDYLRDLIDSVVSLSNLKYYIDIVIDQSVLRKMILAIRSIDDEFKETEIEDVNQFILSSETKFKDAISRRQIDSFKKIVDVNKIIQTKLEILKEKPASDVIGLSTGYGNIDKFTQGFQPGEVTIVAARPSVGKTALSLNFAYNAACNKIPVAIFSLEMPVETITKRLIALDSIVSTRSINSGNFTGSDNTKVKVAMNRLNTLPIYIDDTTSITMIDIAAKLRKLQMEEPNLGLVIIDYIGLISSPVRSSNPDSRTEEVRKISKAIKTCAKDLMIPIVVVCQLNRSVERREGNRPMLSDLRDSGDIEQDADVVMLLYSADYYKNKRTSVGSKKMSDLSSDENIALNKETQLKNLNEQASSQGATIIELNIAKNRNGQTGITDLFFHKECSRFSSPDQSWIEEMNKIRNDSGD